MRVLLLHNRYRSPGGEERTVSDLAALLRGRGHEVEVLERASAGIGKAAAARALAAGGTDPDQVTSAVRRMGAEVVHAHNLHPLFGWRALAAAQAAGARTVLHLHNFRLFCAIAVGYRDGAICFRCRGRNTAPGLRLRCRGSLTEAAAYAYGLYRQQPEIFAHANVFVAVSEATAGRLIGLGLPAERTRALTNFVPATAFADHSTADRGGYALVSGRLVEEKGFDTAIDAARQAEVPLVIAGQGPDEPRLRQLAVGAEVRFTGQVTPAALRDLRRGAGAVLVPSRSEEACPYAALDALADGVPVLASDRGGLPELMGAESVLPAQDPAAWGQALAQLWRDPQARRERGAAALRRAGDLFSEERYYERLMRIYRP